MFPLLGVVRLFVDVFSGEIALSDTPNISD